MERERSYTKPTGPAGPERTFDLQLDHLSPHARATLVRVDDTHGNSLAAFDAMGRPEGSLTLDQIAKLKKAGAMAATEPLAVKGGHVTVTVPAHGLAVVMVQK